jgi:hypothetical protein
VAVALPGVLRDADLPAVSSRFVVVLCAVVLAVVAWPLVRAWRGARVLRRRVRYELLPTSTCDLGWEDIHRAAWVFSRVRPSRSPAVPDTARAVRIRFHSDDGTLHTYLEGPDSARALLRQHIYPQVESRPVDPTEPADRVDDVTSDVDVDDPVTGPASQLSSWPASALADLPTSRAAHMPAGSPASP